MYCIKMLNFYSFYTLQFFNKRDESQSAFHLKTKYFFVINFDKISTFEMQER